MKYDVRRFSVTLVFLGYPYNAAWNFLKKKKKQNTATPEIITLQGISDIFIIIPCSDQLWQHENLRAFLGGLANWPVLPDLSFQVVL